VAQRTTEAARLQGAAVDGRWQAQQDEERHTRQSRPVKLAPGARDETSLGGLSDEQAARATPKAGTAAARLLALSDELSDLDPEYAATIAAQAAELASIEEGRPRGDQHRKQARIKFRGSPARLRPAEIPRTDVAGKQATSRLMPERDHRAAMQTNTSGVRAVLSSAAHLQEPRPP
jgi:hypothetical protein